MKNPEFFLHQKVQTSAYEELFYPFPSALDKPPDCGRPLWSAPKKFDLPSN